ncbi:beta-1,3-galactosyltransferase 1-like [Haliotis cracherodii]|uniref:beta-1,3-galactosyltransferase 1-like n=1 Tax=Haliotis cracherodii TaxID=6455 RepID=UPI0039ED63DE
MFSQFAVPICRCIGRCICRTRHRNRVFLMFVTVYGLVSLYWYLVHRLSPVPSIHDDNTGHQRKVHVLGNGHGRHGEGEGIQMNHVTSRKIHPLQHPAAEQIPGLFNFSILKEDEERHPLINLHQYQFTLNSDLCLRGHVYLLTIVHSALDHYKFRRRIRETFGSIRKAGNKTVVLVFSVGVSDNATLQKNISREANEFKDIIQGNFIDVYRNLSIKHIMGYHWMLNHCPHAAFVLKMDDDMFMNPYVVVNYLTHLRDQTNQILCAIGHRYVPWRDPSVKWYVSKAQYPFTIWPDFCRGLGYIVSKDVLFKLYHGSSLTRFVPMDDVYVTGIVRSNIGLNATDYGTLKYDCTRGVQVSKFLSAGVMYTFDSCMKIVFKNLTGMTMYTNGSYHLSMEDKSIFIS